MKPDFRVGVGIVAAALVLGGAAMAQQETAAGSKPVVVVVDAGHGAHDSGATVGGVREKDVNLAIAKALGEKLTKSGVTVRLTRTGDTFVPLGTRAQSITRQQANFFVSIHSEGAAKGQPSAVVYHHGQAGSSRQLARAIAGQFGQLGQPSRPAQVRSDATVLPQGFAVLRRSSVPAVLVSVGNAADFKTSARQQEAADAIASGLQGFLTDAAKTR